MSRRYPAKRPRLDGLDSGGDLPGFLLFFVRNRSFFSPRVISRDFIIWVSTEMFDINVRREKKKKKKKKI